VLTITKELTLYSTLHLESTLSKIILQ